ncbi:helix-turn-helix transcriptional regulator [uncultured Chitinophaga sp.]|uniref:helix-turn-helix domain-containing protein n=1 Tax=uncultured Chitinophaga sp. TaxID=339340 RepID=UPI0025EF52FC|nr:helix-turn-helix transcriptional regulator [uncultured Chitinophaga sp.]
MKKEENVPHRLGSLTEVHRTMGLPQPKHPLISLLNVTHTPVTPPSGTHVLNYYKISYKPKFSGKLKYGQGYYDFDEGGLLFAAPGQVIGHANDMESGTCSEYILLIHPDFLLNYPIAKKIKQYGFFSYTADEALYVSEEEKNTIFSIFKMIETELNSRIDDFSQDVMISHIELLLNYANRFYKRQFITRKVVNNDVLQKLDDLLVNYFNDNSLREGLPTVHYLAQQLNLSPSYLSDMLRSLIGQNAQQYIHEKLVEKAKELLSTTSLSISEVAFQLGFEHSQSFSRFFKTKANVSPGEFRGAFN